MGVFLGTCKCPSGHYSHLEGSQAPEVKRLSFTSSPRCLCQPMSVSQRANTGILRATWAPALSPPRPSVTQPRSCQHHLLHLLPGPPLPSLHSHCLLLRVHQVRRQLPVWLLQFLSAPFPQQLKSSFKNVSLIAAPLETLPILQCFHCAWPPQHSALPPRLGLQLPLRPSGTLLPLPGKGFPRPTPTPPVHADPDPPLLSLEKSVRAAESCALALRGGSASRQHSEGSHTVTSLHPAPHQASFHRFLQISLSFGHHV